MAGLPSLYAWNSTVCVCTCNPTFSLCIHSLADVYFHILAVVAKGKCQWGRRERGTLVHSWREWKMVLPLWETGWRFLKRQSYLLILQFQFWVQLQRKWSQNPEETSVPRVHGSAILRNGNSSPDMGCLARLGPTHGWICRQRSLYLHPGSPRKPSLDIAFFLKGGSSVDSWEDERMGSVSLFFLRLWFRVAFLSFSIQPTCGPLPALYRQASTKSLSHQRWGGFKELCNFTDSGVESWFVSVL